MPLSKPLEFPDIGISIDADKANYQNYLAWQAQHEARRRESATQFNVFQIRARQRLSSQAQYKEEAEQRANALRDMIERRLSQACLCDDCGRKVRERSDSVSSLTPSAPSSPTASVRSSSSSFGPPLIITKSAGSIPSSRNSLIMSPPPRSRHHKRRTNSATN